MEGTETNAKIMVKWGNVGGGKDLDYILFFLATERFTIEWEYWKGSEKLLIRIRI